MIKEKKGVILISAYLVIGVLLVISSAFLIKAVYEAKAAQRYKENTTAFYLAEAALDKAIAKLPSSTAGETAISLGDGQYTLTITTQEAGKKWIARGTGYIPSAAAARVTRIVEGFIQKKDLPESFWDNAIYTAGNTTLNGNAYDVNGNVIYAGTINDTSNITGTVTQDASVSPLAKLDYNYLRSIAQTQIKQDGSDNIYTAAEISAGNPPLPGSFWFDQANSVPNVVYVETDLVLNGNVGTIGGFILVVGDVITNPNGSSETIINGNGTIDGCVYTTGQFRINGGAGGLNVLGGVWAGSDGARLNGNATVTYNAPYMDAIQTNIQPSTEVQLVSWREER